MIQLPLRTVELQQSEQLLRQRFALLLVAPVMLVVFLAQTAMVTLASHVLMSVVAVISLG